MKTKIYLVKKYMRFYDDKTPTMYMRMKATALWATGTREEAAKDVREAVKDEKQNANNIYRGYWFIEEIPLLTFLS